jgi:uncharacterized protein (DUF2336 family)
MTVIASADLIVDLEAALSSGSPERRALMLQRVTHMLLSRAERLNEHQIGVFDDVLIRLIERVEAQSLVQLSSALCGISPVPKRALRRLACHEEIAVAASVLMRSNGLSQNCLVEIAAQVGGRHLLAISCRHALGEALTDILLKRGDIDVCRVLAKNAGARFSESGYAALVVAAKRNKDIAESLALRSDLPAALLCELLSKTTDTVQLQLLKAAPPKVRQNIREALDSVANHVSQNAPEPVVYSEAHARIVALNNSGKLNDSTVNRFAMRREVTNVIASLCVLSGATIETIEPLMEEKSCDGLIVACRASRLNWQTTLSIIRSRSVPQLSEQELADAREKFEKLFLSTAQRLARFGLSSNSSATSGSSDKALATSGAIG